MANDFTEDSNCVALYNFEDSPGFQIDGIGNNDLKTNPKFVGFPNSSYGVPDSLTGTQVDYENSNDRFYGQQWTATEDGTITHLNIGWASVVNFGTYGAFFVVYVNGTKVGQTAAPTPSASNWSDFIEIEVVSGESLDFSSSDVLDFGLAFDGHGTLNGGISLDNGGSVYAYYNNTLTVGADGPPSSLSFTQSASALDPFCILMYETAGPDEETTTYKVGSQSGKFISTNTDQMMLHEKSLDTGFPFNTADGGSIIKDFTISFWMQLQTQASTATEYFISKYSVSPEQRAFAIVQDSSDLGLALLLGYNSGGDFEGNSTGVELVTGRWYHCTVWYMDDFDRGHMRVWDDTAGDFAHTDEDYVYVNAASPGSGPFALSGRADQTSTTFPDVILDEIVIFNRLLGMEEADKIRNGTFSYPAVNQFDTDSSCVAHWDFLPGYFLTDKIGGNDLTNTGADTEGAYVKTGLQSALFVNANSDSMYIADADQDAGFPMRYDDGGSVVKAFTYCMWVRFVSFPANNQFLCGRWDDDTTMYNHLAFYRNSSSSISFAIGYNSGASLERVDFTTSPSIDTWYHIAVAWQDSDKAYRIRIWDDSAQDFLDDDLTGNFTNNIYVSDRPFYIGDDSDGWSSSDMILDELVVFNRMLSASEIDDVRQGQFTGATTMTADAGSYTVSGTAATLLRDLLVGAGAGSVGLTGQPSNLEYHRLFGVDSGSFALSGMAVSFRKGLNMPADAGTFDVTGTAANFLRDIIMQAALGTYDVTGTTANLEFHRVFDAEAGAYVVTGIDAQLHKVLIMAADSGTYDLTGTAVSLLQHNVINVEAGIVAITGADIAFERDYIFACEVGSIAITGMDVSFAMPANRWASPGVADTTWKTPGAGSSTYENEGAVSNTWKDEPDVSNLR